MTVRVKMFNSFSHHSPRRAWKRATKWLLFVL